MNNFKFQNPTKILFGKGMIKELRKEIPLNEKILLTFGKGSVKQNGIYKNLCDTLEGYNIVEFWGIESNPTVDTIRKVINFARKEEVTFVLAVGGGSVIDASKLVVVAAKDKRDPWDIVCNGIDRSIKPLKLGTIITLPATGSEMNRSAVISNLATKEKYGFMSYYPIFSIIDPTYTYSLNNYQLACGIVDTFIHVMEQYLTVCNESPLMDRWAEGILLTLIEQSTKIILEKEDYDSRSTFMICSTMALNGFISMGVSQDWTTHSIGHEITALTGLAHGHTLSIIYPAMMRVLMNKNKKDKLLQYASRIWGLSTGNEQDRINKAIENTEDFFNKLGLTTRFANTGISQNIKELIVDRFKIRGTVLGENQDIDYTVIENILKEC